MVPTVRWRSIGEFRGRGNGGRGAGCGEYAHRAERREHSGKGRRAEKEEVDLIMKNQMILTPFFLDEALPELEKLAAPDWIINRPVLPDGDNQNRMSVIHRPLADFVRQAIDKGNRPIRVEIYPIIS